MCSALVHRQHLIRIHGKVLIEICQILSNVQRVLKVHLCVITSALNVARSKTNLVAFQELSDAELRGHESVKDKTMRDKYSPRLGGLVIRVGVDQCQCKFSTCSRTLKVLNIPCKGVKEQSGMSFNLARIRQL